MPSISYNRDIPAALNNPSVDQPNMLTNTNSNDDIWDVDHYGFNTANGGWHAQATFPANNVPAAQTDPASVLYTNTGTDTTKSEAFFRNQNGIFPVSALKAAGTFVISSGALGATLSSFNVSTIAKPATTVIITLSATTTISDNVVVLLNRTNGSGLAYSFASNVLSITGISSGSFNISFAILEF